MNRTAILLKNSLKNSLRSKFAIVSILILSAMIIGVGMILAVKYALVPALNKGDSIMTKRLYSIILFGVSLLSFGLSVNVFAGSILMKEKVTGIYESLLATSLNIRQLWIAKIFSVFIPAFVFAEICTAAAFILMQLILINSVSGKILTIPDIMIVFAAVPVIYLFLVALSLLIGLTANPIAGNAVVQAFLAVYAPLSINLALRSPLGAAPAKFLIFNSCFALAGLFALLILLPKLKKESVILSARK